jgi:hypothetical protein
MRLTSALALCVLLAFTSPAFAAPAVDDTAPPTVGIDFPAPGGFTADAKPEFFGPAGTAAGDEATVTVEVFAGDGAEGTPVVTGEVPVVEGEWAAEPTEPLAHGPYTLRVRQPDGAGNVGQAVVGFRVDLEKPALTITAPDADVR